MDQHAKKDIADALLVLRAQLHEETAFTELVHRYSAPLHGYLCRLVGEGTADDVLQQVWIKVHRRIRDLKDPAAFKSWLFTIARSSGLDAVRSVGKAKTVDIGTGSEHSELSLEELGVSSDAERTSDPLAGLALQQALARLDAPSRDLLNLRYEHGLSYQELADALEINVGTVRSRLHNSKARLRSILQGEKR